jgi:hypothetical protein
LLYVPSYKSRTYQQIHSDDFKKAHFKDVLICTPAVSFHWMPCCLDTRRRLSLQRGQTTPANAFTLYFALATRSRQHRAAHQLYSNEYDNDERGRREMAKKEPFDLDIS